MKKFYETAEEAIKGSLNNKEITYCKNTREIYLDLLFESSMVEEDEKSVRCCGYNNNDEWQVHIVKNGDMIWNYTRKNTG